MEVLKEKQQKLPLYIVPQNSLDRYLIEQVIDSLSQTNSPMPPLRILDPYATYSEVASILNDRKLEPKAREDPQGQVITLVGSGGTGITTFLLYYAAWLEQMFPNRRFLLVGMNRLLDTCDISVATQTHACQLKMYRAELREQQGDLSIIYKPYKQNVYTLSAAGEWTAQEISRFLESARREFDCIFLDRGYIQTIDPDLFPLLNQTDEFIYVARPDALSLAQARYLLGSLPQTNARLLLTHYDSSVVSKNQVIQTVGPYPLLGTISYYRNLVPIDVTGFSFTPNRKMKREFATLQWETALLRPNAEEGKGRWIEAFLPSFLK
ncbi:hypothetical protein [Brevibacillus dissolubilis]|uniref:hypothetical protein n=1 Tax=Brevibacillus dissolubilis TaxID=1844116 RepID=UPI0011166F3A|nr:hypothetical protein [Brevibacillus dissolubilis]